MSTFRSSAVLCGVAIFVVSLLRAAAAPSNSAVADKTADVSGVGSLPEDVKTKLDTILDGKMGEFGFTQCDALLETADSAVLIPYLVQVLHDENRDWLARQKAAFALARSGDPRGAAAALQQIRKYLRPGRDMLSVAESKVLYTCIGNLGRYGINEAENEAFTMLTSEYWSGKGFPVPEQKSRDGSWTVQDFRRNALIGLSYAGTDRAVKAFETGEGIPEDLWKIYRGEMDSYAESARKAREELRQRQAAAKASGKTSSSGSK